MAYTKTSKFLSLILRHKPEVIGITLDEHGWARVDEVIAGIAKTRPMSMAILEEIVATATKVGQRHGKPVVFRVDAQAMAAQGHRFYVSRNGVWLTKHVPAEFLQRL